jgi:NADPH2:quinone reductase
VYDAVGQATFTKGLDCLKMRGMMVHYGQSSGPVPPFDTRVLSAKGSLYLARPTLASHIAKQDELAWRAGDVFRWIAEGKLKLRIEQEYPLSDAAQAHRALESRKTAGKLLLRI